jgi:hypothetical protein
MELLTLLADTTELPSATIRQLDKPAAIATVWQGIAHEYHLTTEQSQNLYTQLAAEKIDLVPFSMWLLASQKSHKLSQYMGSYLRYRGDGRSQQDWKFNSDSPLRLPGRDWPDSWQQEVDETVRIAGQEFKVRVTHGLDAVYQLGARPTYNCLHYAHGINQRGLASLLEPAMKVLHIESSRGKPVGNAILRLVQMNDGTDGLTQEPFYQSTNDPLTRRELMVASTEIITQHADTIGVPFALLDIGRHALQLSAIRPRFDLKPQTSSHKEEEATIAHGQAPYGYNDVTGVRQKDLRLAVRTLIRSTA